MGRLRHLEVSHDMFDIGVGDCFTCHRLMVSQQNPGGGAKCEGCD